MSHRDRLFHRATERHIPLTVSLEITSRCNLRCGHCYLPDLERADGVSTERWLRLLDELAEMGTLYLTLTGGEPLVRRDWRVIARRARELGFELRLFSNAALVDDAVAAELAALDVAVEVSVHAVEAEIFDRATGVVGSFARVMRGVELLRRHGVSLKLKQPLTVGNLDQLQAVAELAERLDAEFFADPRIVCARSGDPRPIAVRPACSSLLPVYRSPRTHFQAPAACTPQAADGALCAAGARTCAVGSDGDVTACSLMPGSAGSILERGFREVWETSAWLARLRAVRRDQLRECDRCPRFDYCSRCPAQALLEDGDLMGPARWSCEHAAGLEAAFADSSSA